MAYDELLADRIKQVLKDKKAPFEERKMFGGLCYMVDDKMCVGIVNNKLMARVDPDEYEGLLALKGAGPMDFTKRPMKGFIYVSQEGIDMDEDLEKWVQLCLDYNPKAKSSKKKK